MEWVSDRRKHSVKRVGVRKERTGIVTTSSKVHQSSLGKKKLELPTSMGGAGSQMALSLSWHMPEFYSFLWGSPIYASLLRKFFALYGVCSTRLTYINYLS